MHSKHRGEGHVFDSIRQRAKRSAVDRQPATWTRWRVLSWSLFALAGFVATHHLLAHGGFRPIPISIGRQDLLLGYPTVIVLAITGGMALDPHLRIWGSSVGFMSLPSPAQGVMADQTQSHSAHTLCASSPTWSQRYG